MLAAEAAPAKTINKLCAFASLRYCVKKFFGKNKKPRCFQRGFIFKGS
jgi:hypothetical protein